MDEELRGYPLGSVITILHSLKVLTSGAGAGDEAGGGACACAGKGEGAEEATDTPDMADNFVKLGVDPV